MYLDIEKFLFTPYEYKKMIIIDYDNYPGILSFNDYKYESKNKTYFYLNANNKKIKENFFIMRKSKKDSYILKSYDNIFNIKYTIAKVVKNNKSNITIKEIQINLTIHKPFNEPYINATKNNTLLITYKF